MVDRRGLALAFAFMATGGIAGCTAPAATTSGSTTPPETIAPTSVATPTSATPTAAAPVVFPVPGPLATGPHAATVEGISFTFEASSSGWVADHGRTWAKLDLDREGPLDGLPDGAAVAFWSPDGAYVDPCAHTRGQPVGPTPADLAAAMSTVPGVVVVTGPSDTTIGGLPAVSVELAVPDEAGCAPESLYLWYDTVEAWRWATALGDTIEVWILEVNGARLLIEAETRKAPSAETRAEVEGLIESILFE
jgi:hypothetical protein